MEVHVHTSPEWLLPVLCTFITRIPEKARTGPRKTLWSLTCFSVVHELHGWPCGLDFLRLKCLQVCKYRMHDDGLSFVICVGMQFCVIWCRTSRPVVQGALRSQLAREFSNPGKHEHIPGRNPQFSPGAASVYYTTYAKAVPRISCARDRGQSEPLRLWLAS